MKKKCFLPYNKAQKLVSTLKLKGRKDWKKYCKLGKKPDNIPTNPNIVYKNKGWISFGEWFGTGTIAFSKKQFLPYKEAQKLVSKLSLKNNREWEGYIKLGKKPDNIPTNPNIVYKDKGWISFGEWFGTGVIANYKKQYLAYEEAKKFVHNLKLKNTKDWREYCKSGNKRVDIPSTPNKKYKNEGWISWGNWLGTGIIANYKTEYLTYEEAIKIIHGLKLKNYNEWLKYYQSNKKTINIPATPYKIYKNKGWISFGEWLGTGKVSSRRVQCLSYEELKKILQKENIKSQKEYHEFRKKTLILNH